MSMVTDAAWPASIALIDASLNSASAESDPFEPTEIFNPVALATGWSLTGIKSIRR